MRPVLVHLLQVLKPHLLGQPLQNPRVDESVLRVEPTVPVTQAIANKLQEQLAIAHHEHVKRSRPRKPQFAM
jgi:hypothetical protein